MIAKEQIEHSRLFVRVGHEYFEYVERLVLNVRTPEITCNTRAITPSAETGILRIPFVDREEWATART
jgi:hypothetical protein